MTMKRASIAAGQFKAQCLALIDSVSRTRQPIVITKYGRPIAQLAPLDRAIKARSLKGSVLEDEDIVSPLGVNWWGDKK